MSEGDREGERLRSHLRLVRQSSGSQVSRRQGKVADRRTSGFVFGLETSRGISRNDDRPEEEFESPFSAASDRP